MFTGLLASARELRLPLTVGYAVSITVWLLLGDAIGAAARNDDLGMRLLAGLEHLGVAAQLGLVTFVSAMLGSVLWRGGVAKLVQQIEAKAGHPNWQELIGHARNAAREYGEYRVKTYKGVSGTGRMSPFDAEHLVPSPEWGHYLLERVRERERKAAEMRFRVALAIALVPVAVALGVEGGGAWWLSLVAIPVIWFDVVILKHSALRVAHRYELEDLQEKLRDAQEELDAFKEQNVSEDSADADHESNPTLLKLRNDVERLHAEVNAIEAHARRRATRLFAQIDGEPEE